MQERSRWEEALGRSVTEGGNDAELFFEEYDFDGFLAKVRDSGYKTEFVTQPGMREDSKRVVRLYDPDRHIIEVAEKAGSLFVSSRNIRTETFFVTAKRREKLLRLLWYDREGRSGREENDREDFDRDLRVK